MKKYLFLAVLVFLLMVFPKTKAQPWMAGFPESRITNGELTFFEIQKAFEDYWRPFNVDHGYYLKDGEKIKAAGWKQFKRWEWFWMNRVDPQTGRFPKTSSYQEFQNFQAETGLFHGAKGAGAGNWTSLGPNSTSGGYAGLGRLNCVAFSPAGSSIIYVGAASGGVWKSTNGGSSWSPISDDLGALGISDMIVLPGGSADIIYIATGDRDAADTYSVGVMKSNDGGVTWNTTGLNWSQSSGRRISRLLVDPSNSSILYASTTAGVYKTTDGGANWTLITSNQFVNIQFKPDNSQVLYGSTWSSGDIYRSTDAGTTWTIVLNTAGARAEVAVTAANPLLVYSLIGNTSSGLLGVYKSTDGGATFTQVAGSSPNMMAWNCDGSDSGGQAWYDLCIAADPTNANNVFIGGVNTWKSANGGANWVISNHWSSTCGGIATTVHADKHFFAYQPGTTTLFECNDGGLYKTSNNGTSWTHLGSGLVISQLYRLGVAQTTSGDVIGGLQDNGTKAMLSNSWRDVIGGDGMECLIDYTNNNVQYGELYYGDIYRTDNRWSSSTYITGSLTGSAAWVTPYVIDPANNNILYVGYQDVWKTTNKGSSWTKISSWAGSTLQSLAVAPSNSAYIYAATSSILYRTTNGGTSWTNITGTLPVSSSITYVSVKNNDPNTVWVSFGQFNANKVYQTTDGGVTWTSISAGLPSIPVNCVIQNKQYTAGVELYAGTDIGIFVKVGSADWIPYYNLLPNVVVMELDIYYNNTDPGLSRIRAATYGRGLWESPLYNGGGVNLPPAFTTDPVVEANATAGSPYTATLADNASDPNSGDVLTFSKISGPAWLSVAANGSLSGTPVTSDIGLNTFSVKVDDGKGGTDQAGLQITVTGVVIPVADFSGTPTSIQKGQSVQFTDLSQNSPTSWSWDFGDGKTSILQNPSNTYTVAGTYTVSLTATNSAGSDTEIKTGYITVKEPLSYCTPTGINNTSEYITSVIIAGVTSTTGKGASGYVKYDAPVFNLTAGVSASYSLTPAKTTSHYWKIWIDYNQDGDFLDAGETAVTVNNKKNKANGSFTVPVSASSGTTRMRIAMKTGGTMNPCDGTFTGEVEDYSVNIVKTGIIGGGLNDDEAIQTMPELKLYPNPAGNILNISITLATEDMIIRIYSVHGRQMDKIRVKSDLLQLDLSRYPAGLYYIKLESGESQIVEKFIKD